MTVATILVLVGVALWPNRSPIGWRPAEPRPGRTDGPPREKGDSIAEAADAVLLLALALRSGQGAVHCLDLAAQVAGGRAGADLAAVAAALRWGVEDQRAWELAGPDWEPAAVAWLAASRAGIAPSEILVEASARMRERADELTAAKVQRSAVLLVLPLGGLFLPGFVATTVVPIVLHLVHRFSA